jgi:hypothetical protein
LFLGLCEAVLLMMYMNREGWPYQYLQDNQYIPEALYIFTFAYMAVNATIGGMSVYYAREYGSGTALFILAALSFALKANTCIFGDLIAVHFIRWVGFEWSNRLTVVLNVIPVILIVSGAFQKRKLFKRYPLTDI